MSDNNVALDKVKPVIQLKRRDAERFGAVCVQIENLEAEMTTIEGRVLIWAVEALEKTQMHLANDKNTQAVVDAASERFKKLPAKKQEAEDAKVTYTKEEQAKLDEYTALGKSLLNPFLNATMSQYRALRELDKMYEKRNNIENDKAKLLMMFNKQYDAELVFLVYNFEPVQGIMYLSEPDRFPEQTGEAVKAYNDAVAKQEEAEKSAAAK